MNNLEKFLAEINSIYTVDVAKVRLGNFYDGGYVTLDKINAMTDKVYSAGIGDDVNFELAFSELYPSAEFILFDPTIEECPLKNNKFDFHKAELDLSGLEGDHNLLKMDIEYDEWASFYTMKQEELSKFSQVIVEFHLITVPKSVGRSEYFTGMYNKTYDKMNDMLFEYYKRVLAGLNKLFYIHHIHPNNSLPKIRVGAYEIPPLLEVSFVRKGLVGAWECERGNRSYPIDGLDYPNKTDRSDIENLHPIGGHGLC